PRSALPPTIDERCTPLCSRGSATEHAIPNKQNAVAVLRIMVMGSPSTSRTLPLVYREERRDFGRLGDDGFIRPPLRRASASLHLRCQTATRVHPGAAHVQPRS